MHNLAALLVTSPAGSGDVSISSIVKWLGAIIAFIWALATYILTRNAALYAEFDDMYADVLKAAIENPKFRDPAFTSNYVNHVGEERSAYETYAFMVFNVCETIADGLNLYDPPRRDFLRLLETIFDPIVPLPLIANRKWLRCTWKPVLVAEKQLHAAWLEHQKGGIKFKKGFLELMKEI